MTEIVIIGEYTVDFSRQRITKNGEEIILSKKISSAKAWSFLKMLIRANGRILRYEFLDDSGLWPYDEGFGADHKSSYKSWVSEFNKALGSCKLIKNISGLGYYLDTNAAKITKSSSSNTDFEYSDSPADVDSDNLTENISQLSDQLDVLDMDLDAALQQLEFLKASKDQLWAQNNGADFDSMCMHFTYMKKIVEEKQSELQRLKTSLRRASRNSVKRSGMRAGYSSGATAAIPDSATVISVKAEIQKNTNLLFKLYDDINFLYNGLFELLANT